MFSMRESSSFRSTFGKWDNVFNWTISYRRDSDFLMFYVKVLPKRRKNLAAAKRQYLKQTKKGLLWFVSHCHTPGLRENYASELKQYFPVYIYGKCGINGCKYNNRKCNSKLLNAEYNFYFSAENSNCRDYVTEKAFRILAGFYTLPVVRGGANYSLFLPEHSFVDTGMFSKVSDLGTFLSDLQQDASRYNAYYRWRMSYNVKVRLSTNPFCNLCNRLRKKEKYRRLYHNIEDWWRGDEKSGYFCNDNNV